MHLEKRLLEFIIVHDLLPTKRKWELTVSAVGSMYRNVFHLLGEEDRMKLTDMMREWGFEHSREVKERLGISDDLHGCAVALLSYHRLFGMKSQIIHETKDEVVINVSKCMWKDKKNWTPEICASMEGLETGLVRGINDSIEHFYSKRRSLGHEFCEMHLRQG